MEFLVLAANIQKLHVKNIVITSKSPFSGIYVKILNKIKGKSTYQIVFQHQ